MYRGKPIFYSTGNFAAEIGPAQRSQGDNDFITKMLEKYGTTPDPECPTFNLSRESRRTMIVKAIIENGTISKVSYLPCFVNSNTEPEIVARNNPLAQEVYNYFEDISRSERLPVKFTWDGDEVLIQPV
jgi:poly-gamma-glutamate synthesis protein (capsule biosynthesis protein)